MVGQTQRLEKQAQGQEVYFKKWYPRHLCLCKGLAESISLGHHNKPLRVDKKAMGPFLKSPGRQRETKERAQGTGVRSHGHTSSCTEAKDTESTSPAPVQSYVLPSHCLLASPADLTHKLETTKRKSTDLITQTTSLSISPISLFMLLPILDPSLASPIPQPQRPSQKWLPNPLFLSPTLATCLISNSDSTFQECLIP